MAKKDINQLAKFITDIATGDAEDKNKSKKADKDVKGRSGGLVGGKARANSLTAEQRSEIAKRAAKKRWGSDN
ncbi:hypothetical protein [Mucilaginibacter panaciglaebae]|uniref:Histone H1 n=1 Tax=Mucilaginibacter panaciglaebae TaxID=502331 RepID=A0ABP7X551_9SPHI